MSENRIGRALAWLTVAASGVAGAAAFVALYRLRNDPQPGLGAAFWTAAFLQPIPFVAAVGLAVWCRRRPAVLGFVLAAVVGCGAYGWWWLSGLEEVRRVENEPVRRRPGEHPAGHRGPGRCGEGRPLAGPGGRGGRRVGPGRVDRDPARAARRPTDGCLTGRAEPGTAPDPAGRVSFPRFIAFRAGQVTARGCWTAEVNLRLTPAQCGMFALLGHWLPMGMPREWLLPDRIRHGREFLVRITGRDFGYDAMEWHDYLWDTGDGGYRWARRSRDKWARQVEAATHAPEWQQAVRELERRAEPGAAPDPAGG